MCESAPHVDIIASGIEQDAQASESRTTGSRSQLIDIVTGLIDGFKREETVRLRSGEAPPKGAVAATWQPLWPVHEQRKTKVFLRNLLSSGGGIA